MRSIWVNMLILCAALLLVSCGGDDMQEISGGDGDAAEHDASETDSAPDGDIDATEEITEFEIEDKPDGDSEPAMEDESELESESVSEAETPEADGDEELEPEADQPPATLEISGVDPAFGIYSFSTGVYISGQGFTSDAEVFVGDVAASEVGFVSDNQLYAVFPAVDLADIGPRDVRVVQGNGDFTLERGFAYLYSEDPVVMVHGWSGSPDEMQWIANHLREAGYPEGYLNRIAYSNNMGSNLVNAVELAAFVDEVLLRTGASKVDIVAHSMGGLSSRLYIRNSGGVHVRDYVSTCGAHHGTSETCLAMGLAGEGGKEMCPAYAEEADSYNGIQYLLNGDPDVEDVDETPFGAEDGGWIYYNAIYSITDGVIVPHTSSCLNQKSSGDCTDEINHQVSHFHNSALSAEDVITMVEQFIRRHGPADDM